MSKFLDLTGLSYLWSILSTKLNVKVNNTDYATDSSYGIIKTNSAESVTLNANGQLDVGGRLGQATNTTGIYSPKSMEPRGVADYSMLISEANGINFATTKSLGVITGVNITLKTSAAAGATEYRVANNYANRLICACLVGGYLALNENWAKENQVAIVSSVQINGADYVPSSAADSSANDIIITTATSANPNSATTTVRGYGAYAGYSNLVVGQGVAIGEGGTGAAAVIGASCKSKANWSIVVGNGHYNDQSRNAVFGTNNISRKQNCLLAGQGHDNTNGSAAMCAVGKFSLISSDTAFAVGGGTSHTNRKNLFEIKTNGDVYKNGVKVL